ncbi:hypothetical protein J2752_001034 [Halarchaeum rubridurum]|uniref:Uncharacterized protein n=1 Tax=Halarchaeum rubridurum TaxID=489911 RepID=A0A830FY33_9EURY|nr:hypothetical protein [Halarchaeum rubridurum]MBP1954153.1 hypothetical protein [Halarchaeum rubridurum]GGM57759.1 hypothetical protein GCM10009017_04900 [Halarchaeum rubridurum]
MSTASAQRAGLALLLFGWFLNSASTGVFAALGLLLGFLAAAFVVGAWLADY